MSTANKLTYLNGTKQAIKNAINEDFEVIDNNTTFREYADEISSNNAKYKDLIPKETTNATNTLDISNSANLKALVTQYGNTYQETTTGKNLYSGSNVLTDRFTYIIPSKIGETYTLSFKGSTTETGGSARVFLRNCNDIEHTSTIDNQFISLTSTMTNYSLTLTPTGNGYLFMVIAGSVSNFTFENIMLEKGSTATSYEPYTNGASPNPDYPQTITNVTGTNTIKIVGKNLFDKNAITEGSYVLNDGTLQTGTSYEYNTSDFIPVQPNTTYYKTLSLSPRTKFYDANKQVLDSSTYQDISIGGNAGSFTTPANAYYFRFTINTNVSTGVSLDSVMVHKGSEVSAYEAYKEQSYTINLGSIELCKIRDYKNRIYNSGGKWYLEKNIGKVVLNGSEEWNSETAYTGYYRYILLTLGALNTNNGLNNRFTQRISQAHGGYEYLFIQTNNGAIHIQLLSSRLSSSSIADFKTWLVNNNVTVYYVLATPTTTEITENNYPTLYNQLNNIKLFEGVNHITMTNESGLDVEFDIEYYKDWKLD